MATHSSILAWKNLMERGAWWAVVHGVAWGRKGSGTTEQLTLPYFGWRKGSEFFTVALRSCVIWLPLTSPSSGLLACYAAAGKASRLSPPRVFACAARSASNVCPSLFLCYLTVGLSR